MGKEGIGHDRLFKELISTFFEEFMILFFPEIYEELDFQEVRFLQQEIFTDVTKGERHEVDLLVEAKWKEDDSIIIVHIEPQSTSEKKFNERMFNYFSRIYQKYERKIIPIAIFSYDKHRNEPNSFAISFPFKTILEFSYFTIELKKQNWRKFIHQNNPVAAALLSKMGYTDDERVKVKLEFFKLLTKLKLDKARETLIAGFFESCLQLNDDEEKVFFEEVKKMDKKERDEVMEIMTSYERKGLEKGIEKGIEKGRKAGIEEGILQVAK